MELKKMKREESLLVFLNAATNVEHVFIILSAVHGVYRKRLSLEECKTDSGQSGKL